MICCSRWRDWSSSHKTHTQSLSVVILTDKTGFCLEMPPVGNMSLFFTLCLGFSICLFQSEGMSLYSAPHKAVVFFSLKKIIVIWQVIYLQSTKFLTNYFTQGMEHKCSWHLKATHVSVPTAQQSNAMQFSSNVLVLEMSETLRPNQVWHENF